MLSTGITTPCLALTPVHFAVEFVTENNAEEFWSAQNGVSLGLWHTMLLNSLFKALRPTDSINTQLSRERRYLGGGVSYPRAGWESSWR